MQIVKVKGTPHSESLPSIWVNEFSFESAQEFCQKIWKLDSDPEVEEIFVFVSSYGGEAFPCLMMIEAMIACSKPVNTIAMGLAASCGAILSICGTGKRFMAPNSFLHIHHVSGGVQGDVPTMEMEVKNIDKVNDKMMGMIAAKSNLTKKEFLAKLKDSEKEWRLNPKEAIGYRFIDVIGVPKFLQTIVISADF